MTALRLGAKNSIVSSQRTGPSGAHIALRSQRTFTHDCIIPKAAEQEKQNVARITSERAIGLWQSFVTLLKNPAASQKLEKSWRVARRNRHKYMKRLWATFWESPIGKVLYRIWGLFMILVFPFQIILLTLHMQLYRFSIVYNAFCLEETERAWRWDNRYRQETEVWMFLFGLLKSVFLWALYFAITPATMVWMIPPLFVSFIMTDKWRDLPKCGAFVATAIFWFLKFPLGTPIEWI